MGDQNSTLTEAEARHLLRRTSFHVKESRVAALTGKTRLQAVKTVVRGRGAGYKPRVKYNLVDTNLRREVHDQWVNYMIRSGKQLQELMVLFWHDHFACSDATVQDLILTALQNKLLRRHSIGNVPGQSFKDFVKAINKDGAMMDFLDTIRNTKNSPNENYARELMELFTIGVVDLNGTANYTQADIVQIAKAFTGWRTHYDSGPGYKYGDAFLSTSRHDFTSPKTIFTTVGGFQPTGRDITENGTGEVEIDTVIDILFDHTDSDGKSTVARHITYKLLEYFAHAAPDKTTIDDIIQKSNFDGSTDPASAWQIAPLLREILMHDFFYSTATQPQSIAWPVHFVVRTLRHLRMKLAHTKFEYGLDLDGDSGTPNTIVNLRRYHLLNETGKSIQTHLDDMGQLLFEPPSVFGWDWESAWINSGTLLARAAFAVAVTKARGTGKEAFRPETLLNMSLSDPGDIADAVTRVLGVPDRFPNGSTERDILISYLTDGGTITPDLTDDTYVDVKLRGLFTLVMQSPAYQVQ